MEQVNEHKEEQILISIAGIDRPGLTADVMKVLAKYNATVLDIGQSNIHSTLSLGVLIRADVMKSGQIMRELLFEANDLHVNITFQPISDDDYESWVGRQGKHRFILTIMGRELSAEQIFAAADVIKEQKPEHRCHTPSDRSCEHHASVEEQPLVHRVLTPRRSPGPPADAVGAHELSADMGFDFSLQKDDMYRRMRRLICFDMDSTLIQTECIDELAKRAGVGDQVSAITASAMRGEIDFKESFTRRVALLKGLDASVMKDIADHLPITEGVDKVMKVLKTSGYKIAILSGGFTYFGQFMQRKYGIDYVYANELEVGEDGKLTGRYLGEIVDGHRKAELLSSSHRWRR